MAQKKLIKIKFVAGIDFGSSTTDAIILNKTKKIISSLSLNSKNLDIVKLKKFISNYDLEKTAITGSGAIKYKKFLKEAIIVNEMIAIGKGGQFVSRKKMLWL
jgi:activator of 2-hydroxyglutaryl-CoA dehydratase